MRITVGLFLISLLSFFSAASAQTNPISSLVENVTDTSNYFVFGEIRNYYLLIDQLESKKVELQVLAKSNKAKASELESIATEIQALESAIEDLNSTLVALDQQEELSESEAAQAASLIESRTILETQLAEKKIALETLEASLNPALEEGQISQEQALQKDIVALEESLEKSQIRLVGYGENFIKKVMLALGIWLFSIVLKAIIGLVFNRLHFYITAQRKLFILQLIRLVINAVTIIAILLVFFSQLMSALPYFAIFATALAFAMRDVILSVIAWIIIGTKDGYKVGHYLHIGTLWGTVVEVNPFNTIVRQGGMSGQTGRLLTFPNKKIFEEFLENWSKLYDFTFLKWDFYLEQGSDIEKAETILLKVLADEQAKFKDIINKKRNQFIKNGLADDDLEPHIFWEIQANGILLRGKLLVDFNDFFTIRSAVTRAFIIEINKEENIQLRFVNNLLPNTL
jgi:small-conductance mechanosensitive channel